MHAEIPAIPGGFCRTQTTTDGLMRPTFYRISAREIVMIALPVLVLAGGAVAVALHYMQPTPPRSQVAVATAASAAPAR